jgi:hypothetical protein
MLAVKILQEAASKLNVNFWNFSVDPCDETGAGQWFVSNTDVGTRQVKCGDCNSSTNVCHIVSMYVGCSLPLFLIDCLPHRSLLEMILLSFIHLLLQMCLANSSHRN